MLPRTAFALVAFVVLSIPFAARAKDDDDAEARPTKRRASLMLGPTRQRVGTSAPHETAAPPRAVAASSIGSPSQGRLEGGVRLDTSRPYVRVVPAYARGDVRWGLPTLTHALEHAAHAVAKRYPGSVMGVGDMSLRHGGDVLRHHSHESGRDADVAFFVDDAKGRPLNNAPTFVRFDANLRATNLPGARFDEAKNWLFVERLLSEPGMHVSHIFIAEPIRQHLLAYGRVHAASHAIWERAAMTLMQPTDSEAHDDHMHVRVSCPSSSQGACVEYARAAIHHPKVIARVTKRAVVLQTPPRPAPKPLGGPAPASPAESIYGP